MANTQLMLKAFGKPVSDSAKSTQDNKETSPKFTVKPSVVAQPSEDLDLKDTPQCQPSLEQLKHILNSNSSKKSSPQG